MLNAFSVGRYSVSWYVGKLETLCSATVLLMILLAEVSLLYRRLGTMATIDVLTQVANRRSFDDDARWALNVRKRHPLSLAFLMIDVDHFKLFNDSCGHHAGDVCLRRVADAIRRNCGRIGDLVARYGGEEFVVLMLGPTSEGAATVAEAIRAGVEAMAVAHPASPISPVVTVSVGAVFAAADAAVDLDGLFRAADASLYRAKLTRNAVDLEALTTPVEAVIIASPLPSPAT
jgi:diguanylate cyclase (GGDEF)-like protein